MSAHVHTHEHTHTDRLNEWVSNLCYLVPPHCPSYPPSPQCGSPAAPVFIIHKRLINWQEMDVSDSCTCGLYSGWHQRASEWEIRARVAAGETSCSCRKCIEQSCIVCRSVEHVLKVIKAEENESCAFGMEYLKKYFERNGCSFFMVTVCNISRVSICYENCEIVQICQADLDHHHIHR